MSVFYVFTFCGFLYSFGSETFHNKIFLNFETFVLSIKINICSVKYSVPLQGPINGNASSSCNFRYLIKVLSHYVNHILVNMFILSERHKMSKNGNSVQRLMRAQATATGNRE